jgi:GDP/UDP-N,N'-diacetylbacillosamine 2-epimerase (hydrolysing)
MVRRICFVSGKRGGFGVLSKTMQKITDDPELELKLIITDMHLSEKFGKTKQEVNKHFHVDYEVDIIKADGDTRTERGKALGRCLTGMIDALNATKPDLLLLYGDRGEIVATALAAVNLGIPIAHLQGGEVTGGLDEPFRHALTKFANIHLVSSDLSKERIMSLGEEEWRITKVGQPHIDLILEKDYHPEEKVREKFGIKKGEKLLIVLQHPVSTNPGNSYKNMRETMEAIKELGHKTILIYPCSDQGYSGIIKAIEEYKDELPFLQVFKNLEFQYFLGLLAIADAFVGNSSSAIIEAPYFCLPTINIGERQKGRERSNNVIDVGYDAKEIITAVKKALTDDTFQDQVKNCRKPFGIENVSDKIVKTLKETPIDAKLHDKKLILR